MQSISHLSPAEDGGFRAIGITDNGVKDRVPILEARAAAVPPTGTEPGYYLILGQKLEALPNGKRPLLLLAEGMDDNQGKLLKRLGDDARRLNVRVIYAIDGTGFHTALWELFRSAQGIRIQPAPFPEDLEYGLAMIREWLQDKALDVPDVRYQQTELRSQLERMMAKNMGFVADALRFLIGGFVQYQPHRAVSAQSERRPFYWG